MIVLLAAGIAVQAWLKWPHGVAVGLLAGLIIASLLPPKAGSCGVSWGDDPTDGPVDAEDVSASGTPRSE